MDELNESQSTTSSASPSGSPSHRRPAGDKLMELEGRSFMGRFAPRELLDGIDGYLSLETPEHRDQLLAAIRTRAEQLQEQDKDLPVDGQSEGMLALTSALLRSL
jgi:hypothetical protein